MRRIKSIIWALGAGSSLIALTAAAQTTSVPGNPNDQATTVE
jgi:hypothetical protein